MQDSRSLHARAPTFFFTVEGVSPVEVTEALAGKEISVRDGNMYSPRLLHRLGLPPDPRVVRASFVHYNTVEEIERFVVAIQELVARA